MEDEPNWSDNDDGEEADDSVSDELQSWCENSGRRQANVAAGEWGGNHKPAGR